MHLSNYENNIKMAVNFCFWEVIPFTSDFLYERLSFCVLSKTDTWAGVQLSGGVFIQHTLDSGNPTLISPVLGSNLGPYICQANASAIQLHVQLKIHLFKKKKTQESQPSNTGVVTGRTDSHSCFVCVAWGCFFVCFKKMIGH